MGVKNVEPQTYGIGFCLLVRSPGHSYAHCSLRNIALEPVQGRAIICFAISITPKTKWMWVQDPGNNLLGTIKYERSKESADEQTPWLSKGLFQGGEIKKLKTSVSDVNSRVEC